MATKKAAIYARVSSTGDRQSTARQVADLTAYAASADLEVVRVYEEKASGARDDREVLADCLAFLKDGGADILLVSELSRLGRSLRRVLEVVAELTSEKKDIYFHDHRLHTLRGDGTPDPVTKLLVSLMGTFAEMEREQISYRLNSGRKAAIGRGVRMGRKPGYRIPDGELLAKYPDLARRLRKGLSIREAAVVSGVSPATAAKVRKVLQKKGELPKPKETAKYLHLCRTRPDGDIALSEKEAADFEKWLEKK